MRPVRELDHQVLAVRRDGRDRPAPEIADEALRGHALERLPDQARSEQRRDPVDAVALRHYGLDGGSIT